MATRVSHRRDRPHQTPTANTDDPYRLVPVDPYADVVLQRAARLREELRTAEQDEWGWAA